jgi:GT2 family glycosyltransferase
MIDLTVSIVNHKHRDLLGPLLSSIRALTQRASYETYVVDNASGDGSADMVQIQFPWVHLISNEQPQGFAANNNQVLRQGQGRYLILLNDDMLLHNDALDRLVAFMDAYPDVGAAGCKLLNKDGTLQRSCWRGFPSPRTLLIDLFYLSKWAPWLPGVRDFEVTLQDISGGPVDVDYLLGACLMVRREALEQVGPLDESFFMFLEETDWCYRIRQKGWRIVWMPDGEIIHYGQQSVGENPERFVPMLYSNYYRFCQKHGTSRPELLALKGVILAGASLRTALWTYRSFRGHSDGRAMVSGYLRTLRAMPAL